MDVSHSFTRGLPAHCTVAVDPESAIALIGMAVADSGPSQARRTSKPGALPVTARYDFEAADGVMRVEVSANEVAGDPDSAEVTVEFVAEHFTPPLADYEVETQAAMTLNAADFIEIIKPVVDGLGRGLN